MTFNESSQENPIHFFEDLYTENGLEFVWKEFHTIYQCTTPHDSYDKTNDTYSLYERYYLVEQNEYDDEYDIHKYSFLNYMENILKKEEVNTIKKLTEKLKSITALESDKVRIDKLNQFIFEIINLKKFINQFTFQRIQYKKLHLKFINQLLTKFERKRNDIETIFLEVKKRKTLEELITELSNKLKIATNPDDTKKLIKFFSDNEYNNENNESIRVGIDNRQLHYIISILNEQKYIESNWRVISKSKFFKSKTQNKPISESSFSSSSYNETALYPRSNKPKDKDKIDFIFGLD